MKNCADIDRLMTPYLDGEVAVHMPQQTSNPRPKTPRRLVHGPGDERAWYLAPGRLPHAVRPDVELRKQQRGRLDEVEEARDFAA